MRIKESKLTFAPTDLPGHLSCRHLTSLDLRAARGEFHRPVSHGPVIEILRKKGIEHERGYLAHLKTQHEHVAELGDHATLEETLAAMASGAEIIYQANLSNGDWDGYADFLVKVPTPSRFGPWSYEAQDTKLAQTTRAGTILQLCVYTMLLEELQGAPPAHMHVGVKAFGEPRGENVRFTEQIEVVVVGMGAIHVRRVSGRGVCKAAVAQAGEGTIPIVDIVW